MLRIDSVERISGTNQLRVIYSLSPANATTPRWRCALVPDNLNMFEVDWVLRNHWAQAETNWAEEGTFDTERI